MERIWGNWEEMEREWGYRARYRMRERKNFISVFPSLCCKTLKFLTFCHKTLKYVTFCRKMLKYGTFCRECCKNLNIRAMRKWFWIKSGCEEAPQVVPAWWGGVKLYIFSLLWKITWRYFGEDWSPPIAKAPVKIIAAVNWQQHPQCTLERHLRANNRDEYSSLYSFRVR